MSKLSIKINIAGRIYPMKIERKSEEHIRNAVKKIEGRLKFYEENYAIKDKQDLLAMCLIEYTSKFESVNNKNIHLFSMIYQIDGFLIGGASRSSKKFIDILKNYYK